MVQMTSNMASPVRVEEAVGRVVAAAGASCVAVNEATVVQCGRQLAVQAAVSEGKTIGGLIAGTRFGIGSLQHGPLAPHAVTIVTAEHVPPLIYTLILKEVALTYLL